MKLNEEEMEKIYGTVRSIVENRSKEDSSKTLNTLFGEEWANNLDTEDYDDEYTFLTVGELKEIIKNVPNNYKIEHMVDCGTEYAEYCDIDNNDKTITLG